MAVMIMVQIQHQLREDGIIDFTSTITVSDDENTLTEYISDDEICTVVRTNLADPCE
jgi:hypothetical protein